MKALLRTLVLTSLAAVLAFGTVGPVFAASIIYVKANASGLNNGSSWKNAYKSLQSALAAATAGKQIWVAAGTYKPTSGTDRTFTFMLKNGVAIYGGFAGTETLLSQRNPALHVTILSGDIGTAGDKSDNSYSVVSSSGADSTAILDGFTITAGNADCGCFPGDIGAGVFNWVGNPTFRNLVISNNAASGYGAGMYNETSNPTLTKVVFSANTVQGAGGGMYNSSSNPTLTNVAFSGNSTTFFGNGGGMYNNSGSSPRLTNVTFSGNSSVTSGGGLYNVSASNPILTNVIFSSNLASAYGGGIYNDTSSPTLTNVVFSSNSASNGGGGIYNVGSSPALTGVTFSGNSGSAGGAIENYNISNPVLKNVTFYGNSASNGGAVYDYSSSPTLTNTTFSGNTAGLAGPAMDNENSSSPVINDSIFWNDPWGEIWNTSPGLTVSNSIITGGCPSASTCTNVYSSDPFLGPLLNNGGFTRTMALGVGSYAIDAGDNSSCVAQDQRGVPRPQGDACDIGAYEVRAKSFNSVAAYDGWVLETAKSSNKGGSLNSTATTLRVGDDAANRRYRAILSFDTSSLPDAAKVIKAVVRVRQQASVGNPFNTQGTLQVDVVKPYFGTSLVLANSDWQASSGSELVGSFMPDSSWYWSPLMSTAFPKINRVGPTQFRLHFSTEIYDASAEYLALYSGNYAQAASRPKLIVYFNP